MTKSDQEERPTSAGTDVAYEAPAGASYGQHHLDRYAQAGANNREVGQLAAELEALAPDERAARLDKLSAMSNADLAGELRRRRRAADDGRDPAEVGNEIGAPLAYALTGDGPNDDVHANLTGGEGASEGEGAGAGEDSHIDDTSKHTIDEVLNAVGDDPDKAQRAMASERARTRPRTSLLDDLQQIVDDAK